MERAAYLDWLIFAETRLEPLVLEVMRRTGDPVATQARLEPVLELIEAGLGSRELLVGDRFNAADLVTVSILHPGEHVEAARVAATAVRVHVPACVAAGDSSRGQLKHWLLG